MIIISFLIISYWFSTQVLINNLLLNWEKFSQRPNNMSSQMKMLRHFIFWKILTKNSSINLIQLLSDMNLWLISRKLNGLKENKLKDQNNQESHTYKKCGNKIKENSQEKELINLIVNNLHLTTKKEFTPKQTKMVHCSQRKIKHFSPLRKTHTVNIVRLLNNLPQKLQLNLVSAWVWIDILI